MAQSDVPWTKLKALSFDLYGTLIDWQEGLINAALATKLRTHLPTDRGVLYEQLRKQDRLIEREMPHLKKSEINAEALRRYADKLQLINDGKATREEVEEAARLYGRAIGSFGAFSDTVRLQSRNTRAFC